jgi:hypothetical protein
MIPSIDTLIPVLVGLIAMTFGIMFLPGIIELRKPQDAGPRQINPNAAKIALSTLKISIPDIEEEQKTGSVLTQKNASFFFDLFNLES